MKDDSKLKPQEFESHWQKIWQEKRIYQPDLQNAKNPYYNLMMFPYPSAEGLHVGNMYAFTGVDIHGRFMRMRGFDVFEPIGLDGFGIHSENYALKIGKHPKEQAKVSESNYYRQLSNIGNSFSWENRLETYDPDYYRWTQWIFIRMFKKGLAYRKKSPVNFCPSCKTVLSDEQVIDGKCERCKSEVEKRQMEQWFFKITNYAERLLQNTYRKDFNWTEKVKIGQRNWIGKKEGINITYPVIMDALTGPASRVSQTALQTPPTFRRGRGREASFGKPSLESPAIIDYITCFTTRPDTNFGATFVVIGPEHPFVASLLRASLSSSLKLPNSLKKPISDYIEKTKSISEKERIAKGRKKTGVFTGFYCVNGLNGYKMPIYISDFVLGHVGTGAVVAVPGHDLRDFEFAKTFDIPIIRVVVGKDGDQSPITKATKVQEEEGTMINSEFLNGMDIRGATVKMMDHLEEKGMGKRVITYKLRDWCISRQRYWGAPIPMIFCSTCASKGVSWYTSQQAITSLESSKLNENLKLKIGNSAAEAAGWFPVPDDQLPVLLPDLEDWKPEGTGKGPLAKLDSFKNVKCPNCGGNAERETDVCDTFLDSSWYFLRYPFVYLHKSPKLLKSLEDQLPWDKEVLKHWFPVHSYIGGAEHTVLHLLYARFVTMVFKDLGYLYEEEPFKRFYAHGLIIAEGAKMSKSKGNVIIPDEYIKKYGADTLRTYLMFLGPFDAGGDFRDTGVAGMYKFLWRVWRLVEEYFESSKCKAQSAKPQLKTQNLIDKIMHKTIKEVTEDLENLRYNTAISHIMEYVNEMLNVKAQMSNLPEETVKTLLLLLAPFAPHMTEELWSRIQVGNVDKVEKSKSYSSTSSTSSTLSTFQSIHLHPWPAYDPKYLVEDEVTVIVQINGKTREVIKIASRHLGGSRMDSPEVEESVATIAKNSEKVKKYLQGQTIRKVIFIPGKLINFVT